MNGRATAARVGIEQVSVGAVLGRGGQGVVRAVSGMLINRSWTVVYKEYGPGLLDKVNVPALEAMVAFLGELDTDTGRWIAEHMAWPAALVVEGERTRGFLMRQVPEVFLRRLHHTPNAVPVVGGFEFLLNSPDYLARVGISISLRQRLQLLLDLAHTFTRLHALDIVVGDLSPKNVLFKLDPQPSCFLIDCDAMRLQGRDVLPQAETPSWALPTGEPVGTVEGDAYKFGLIVIRTLDGSQDGHDTAAVDRVAAELGVLARRSLSASPARRPAPADWLEPLDRALALHPAGQSKSPVAGSGARVPPLLATGPWYPVPRTATPRIAGEGAGTRVVVGLGALLLVLLLLISIFLT